MTERETSRVRVVATVGPACRETAALRRLVEAGAGVLRLNLSHGDLDGHLETLRDVRDLERELGTPIAVMADLPGPKIRVARASTFDMPLGAEVLIGRIDAGEDPGFQEIPPPVGDPHARLRIDAPQVLESLRIGHRVLLDDGAVRLLVTGRDEGGAHGLEIVASVITAGTLRPRVGVNVPDSDPDLPAVTPRDLELARAMHAAGVDLVAVSFCRHGDDLRRLRAELVDAVSDRTAPWMVSKVERPAAIEHLEDVIDASDAVLVARGDLGVEMDIAEVPIVQKRIVAASIRAGRPVIVATQMLQSMISAPTPTRAEATDVANAVLDGADALMLSGETAIGRHPVLAVETLRRIAGTTERWREATPSVDTTGAVAGTEDDPWLPALARGVHRIARDLPIRAVVAWSGTGHTARVLSREDLRVPLVVLTEDEGVARRMRLLRGVRPVLGCLGGELGDDRDAFLAAARDALAGMGLASPGDACLFVHGSGRDGTTASDAIGVFRFESVVPG